MVELRQCRDCGETKPVTDFYKSYKTKAGEQRFAKHCKACASVRARDWYTKNTEYAREYNREKARRRRQELGPEASRQYERRVKFKHKYGISVDEWNALHEQQGGSCAICQDPLPDGKFCHVDHDHKTGSVRGLLCHLCNPGLGYFQDDPNRLRAAIAYLEGSSRVQESSPVVA